MLGSALDVGTSCSAGAHVFGRKELGFGDSPWLGWGKEEKSNERWCLSLAREGDSSGERRHHGKEADLAAP